MVSGLSTMLALIALASLSGFVFTYLARFVAPKLGLIDCPDGERKSHAAPTPVMGGVALFCSLLLTLTVAALTGAEWFTGSADAARVVLMILVSGGLFCLLGYYDDRKSIRPRTKLLFQIAASIPFVVWGRSIESVELLGVGFNFGLFGILFTTFWLVACTNILNLVDGLDGLAGTIGLIVCLAIAGHSALNDFWGPTAIALIFAASLFGFLLHNWPPAKIFLGDSGSLLIGFVIGALSIESSLKTATSFAMAIPLVLVSVPIFDTLMAILRRKLNGRGIGEADRGHIHHCLQKRGLSRAKTLLAISGLCMVMVGVTLVSAYFQNDLLALGLCFTLLTLLIIGRVFGYNETLLFFHYMRAMSLILVDTSDVLRTRLFLVRMSHEESEPTGTYWDDVTAHVQRMGGYHLEFVYWDERNENVMSRLVWSDEFKESDDTVPIHNRDADWQFSYSLPGENGTRASLIASGQSQEELKGQRLIDLFHLFKTFCRNWTNEVVVDSTLDTGASVPLTVVSPRHPRIIPAPFNGSQDRPENDRLVA